MGRSCARGANRLRKPIAQFLSTIGGRLTKLSIAGVELELAAAPNIELSGDAKSFGGMDPQTLANDSASQTLTGALQGDIVPNSYVVIDLGVGKSWLISRLFIFAIMLRRVRGVRCFVFVDRSGRVPNEYLGTISTEDIHLALAQRYPPLDRVFAKAYKDQLWQGWMAMTVIRTLDQSFAIQVVREYVALLKQGWDWKSVAPYPSEVNAATAIPADGPWVQLGTSMEYGLWIDRDLLRQAFKDVIHEDQVSLASGASEKTRETVNAYAPFLAVVRASGQFVYLIDRAMVLEGLATRRAADA